MVYLIGLIRYETLMQWRRGALRTLIVVLIGGSILWSGGNVLNNGKPLDTHTISADQVAETITAYVIANSTFASIVLAFIVPLLYADTITIDHSYRTNELLGTLPVTKTLYLAGKLLSVWLPLLAVLLIALILSALINWNINGAFYIVKVVEGWLVGPIPLALFGSGLSVLLGGAVTTRQSAMLIGLFVVLLCLGAYLLLINDFMTGPFARIVVASTRPDRLYAAPPLPSIASPEQWIKLLLAVLLLALTWTFVWWRLRRRTSE